jgi:hypothetical protein
MGEVYRATDRTLRREVAIKVLPAAFSEDRERLDRFEREAQLLAQLQHPNIAAIFGLEGSGGRRALVMELVEGPTLAERLAGGALSLEESLAVALEIALALEEAHEKGIIHRDLKPQNIKASADGKVKVLDFGLAKALEPVGSAAGAASPSQLAASPTLTLGATARGVILGTAAYMAPEQAKGLPVDKRADIWAFGVILYEMLTGKRLFEGDSVPDTLAEVLKTQVDLSRLPPEAPGAIHRLLRRCLERNPKNRLHDIADARLVLAEAQAPGAREAEGVTPTAQADRRGLAVWLPWAVAVAGALFGVLGIALAPRLRPPERPLPVTRTSILAPPSAGFARTGVLAGSFALAPDGTAVVFVASDESGRSRLWLRELTDPATRLLDGTEDAELFPFWSPDAREIAYFAGGHLRRVARAGGVSQQLCAAANPRGGVWGPDGTILFAPDPYGPLARLPASGGEPRPATTLDGAAGEASHRFPTFLPDGRHFLFAVDAGLPRGHYRIEVGSLDQPETRAMLFESEATPRFAPPRYLVFAREGALLAQEIDLDRLQLLGEPKLLAEPLEAETPIYGTPTVDLSRDGRMLYVPRDSRPTELVWIDRQGRIGSPIVRQEGSLWTPVISRRGERLAAMRVERGNNNSLWLFDLALGGGRRISAANRTHFRAAWANGDRELITLVTSEAETSLVRIDTEDGRERKLLDTGGRWLGVKDVSADGRHLLYSELTAARRNDLGFLRLEGEPVLAPYLESPAGERDPIFSPDGRWVAYVSDASGRPELYIDRFPEPGGARRVPSGGDVLTLQWPQAAGEIFFAAQGRESLGFYSCRVRTSPELEIGTPERLFELSPEWIDVAALPDGQRFVLLRPYGERPPSLTLVQNWMAGLQP